MPINLNDPEAVKALADVLIAVATLIASTAVPIVIYFGQRRRDVLQYSRAVAEMWMTLDVTVLQSEDLLALSDYLIETKAPPSMTDRRKKWLAYMVLNTVYMEHLGDRYRLTRRQQRPADGPLRVVLRDEDVFTLSQSKNAYDAEFRETCLRIREEWKATSEETAEEAETADRPPTPADPAP